MPLAQQLRTMRVAKKSITPSHTAISKVTTTTTAVACSVSLGEEKWTFESSVQDSLTKLTLGRGNF